jgi:hypothetical protein
MPFLISCFACIALVQAAAVPASTLPPYQSPFADYQRFDADARPKPWREANDAVREAGGHVGILKGMSAPAAATAAGKSPAGGAAAGPAKPPPAGKDKPVHDHGQHGAPR